MTPLEMEILDAPGQKLLAPFLPLKYATSKPKFTSEE